MQMWTHQISHGNKPEYSGEMNDDLGSVSEWRHQTSYDIINIVTDTEPDTVHWSCQHVTTSLSGHWTLDTGHWTCSESTSLVVEFQHSEILQTRKILQKQKKTAVLLCTVKTDHKTSLNFCCCSVVAAQCCRAGVHILWNLVETENITHI